MQVIPCGPPCVPYVANDLPGLHLLACGDADGLAVGVEGLQAAAVVELDVVAIAAAPTVHAVGDYDGTIGGGQDGRACGGSNVGAAVVADLAGDGIGAVAERRGNAARNRQRPLQRAGALPGTGRGQNLPTAGQKPTQPIRPTGFRILARGAGRDIPAGGRCRHSPAPSRPAFCVSVQSTAPSV